MATDRVLKLMTGDGSLIPKPSAADLLTAIPVVIDTNDNFIMKSKDVNDVVFDLNFGNVVVAQTLSDILSNGETMLDGQVFDALNGGGQLDLRQGSDNTVNFSNDGGSFTGAYVFMDDFFSEMARIDSSQVAAHQLGPSGTGQFVSSITDFGAFHIFDDPLTYFPNRPSISIVDNAVSPVVVGNLNNKVILIGTEQVTVPAGLDGIVVINGSGHTINAFLPDATYMSNVVIQDAKDILFDTITGSKIGTDPSQKIGKWGGTPVVQPATAGTNSYAGGGGGGIDQQTTSDGGLGGAGYTMSDLVRAAKERGDIAA